VPQRFAIRYGSLRALLSLMGLGPGVSGLDLDGDQLRVRMGWGFRATLSRASIRSAERTERIVWGIGVHGWRASWLVNGAVSGLVTLRIEPVQRAWVLGVPVRLRVLTVSVEDPDAVVRALAGR
jgi:hypothetical protein